MNSDILIDHKKFNRLKKQYEPEKLSDLFFPNPSSPLKIIFNTTGSILIGGIWSLGFKRMYKVSSKFPFKFIGFLSLYSASYSFSKEFSTGYMHNNFNLNNIGLSNLFALLISSFVFLPIGFKGTLEIPKLYYKFCAHYFVGNLYWDIFVAHTRSRILRNSQNNQTFLFDVQSK